MGNGIGNSFGAARPSVLASDRERRYFRRRLAVVALGVLAVVLAAELILFNYPSYRLLFGSYATHQWAMDEVAAMQGLEPSESEPDVYVATTSRPYLEWTINERVGTLRLDIQSRKKDRYILMSDIFYTDDAHHNYIESPAYLEVLRDTPRTQYKSCDYAGTLGKLKLRLHVTKGEKLVIRGLTVNQRIPLNFSVWRVALLWLFAVGVYVFRRSPSFRRRYDTADPVHRWTPVVLTALFMFSLWGLFALYETPFIHTPSFTAKTGSQITQELVDALEAGQTSLLEKPSEALLQMRYPYEWTARDLAGVDYLWDHLLYNGKYYSYYGIGPVLVFFLPYHLLTGCYFPTDYACLLFGLAGTALLAAAYCRLMQHRMRRLPFSLCMSGLLLVLVTSGVQFSGYRPHFYEMAETAGFMFYALGLYFLSGSGLLGDRPIRLHKLALSGVSISLAVLSRPTFALYAIAAVIWLWFGWMRYRAQQPQPAARSHVVRYALAALLPYVLFGGLQMAYNYARFGSPFEFGIRYSLTINDFTHTEFHTSLAAVSLYNLLIALPQFQLNFPFVLGSTHQLDTNAYYYFETASAIGLLWRALPLGGLCYAPRALKPMSWRQRGRLLLIVGLPTVVFPLLLMALTWESGYALRYSVDFAWQLVLGGLLVCFYVYSRSQSPRMRRFLETTMVAAVVWCCVSTAALSLARVPDDVTVSGVSLPLVYYRIARTLTFWK